MILLKNCKFIITQNKEREILEEVDILIKENKIAEIKENIKENSAKTIDCSQKIIMPGLINCHTHIGMHKLRGYSDDKQLHKWLDEIIAEEKKLTEEEIKEYAKLAAKEMISSGTTTFNEMYGHIKSIISGISNTGIRAILCPAYFDRFETDKIKVDLSEELKLQTNTIKIGISPHSIYGCSQKLLDEINKYAKENNLIKQIHVGETKKEVSDSLREHKKTPVGYLNEIKFLDKNTLLIHGCWMSLDDLNIMKEHNCKLIHCPTSNLKLASGGVTPVVQAWERNIPVGLGTDSVCSNNNMDLFEEMKLAAILHKNHLWNAEATTAQKVLDMGTIDGAACLNREKEIGSIEQNKFADIIMLDANSLNLQPCLKERIVSHLVYAAKGCNVSDVIIDGKLVYVEREFKF